MKFVFEKVACQMLFIFGILHFKFGVVRPDRVFAMDGVYLVHIGLPATAVSAHWNATFGV